MLSPYLMNDDGELESHELYRKSVASTYEPFDYDDVDEEEDEEDEEILKSISNYNYEE